MSRWKKIFVSGTTAIAITVTLPVNALAAAYSDNVAGVEVYATATEGIFVGTASGLLPGTWSLTVLHTPLSEAAKITGGTFDLATVQYGRGVLVTGVLSGGSVSQTGSTAPCVNQTYKVDGSLAHVGVNGQSRRGTSGSFSATLTHYRYMLFGACITYGASIAGAVSLVF